MNPSKPSVALSNPQEQCVTFCWDKTPQYHLGYRFVERQPTISDQPLDYKQQPVAQRFDLPDQPTQPADEPVTPNWKKEWWLAYAEQDHQSPVQLTYRTSDDGVARVVCIENDDQQQEFVFQPFAYGVRIWATLTTNAAIEGSCCRQQCLRFTGMFNSAWRQIVARTPFLSELDMQAMGNANGTLTYARRAGQWVRFPVQYTVYPTSAELANAAWSDNNPVDHGLIVRETASRQLAPASYWRQVAPDAAWEQIASGMYWERTAYISNRHPADCVHSWIDYGPLAAGQSRTLRGAVYFIERSKDDLLALWQDDFKSAG